MAEQPNKNNTSEEIDLGQLFQMIGRGFNKLGIAFLRLFLYLKKRAFILGGLVVLGLGIGYGLNQITEEKKKIEVIVKPNLDSENYLYDVVKEIDNNIKSQDTSFFNNIGVSFEKLAQFEISVEPIETKEKDKKNIKYLELLEKFQGNSAFSDLVRIEFLKNSTLNHRITFKFKDSNEGELFARAIIQYVNSTEFFQKLTAVSIENASERIKQNEILIEQVDALIQVYINNLKGISSNGNQEQVFLDNEERLNVTGLLRFKSDLITNIENKRIELQESTKTVNIINFGKVQKVTKPFFGKKLVLIPTLLILLFFILEILKEINRKAKNIIS